MRVDEFDFDLPKDRIALSPAEPRDSARMLCVGGEGVSHSHVRELPSILRPGDVLVANDTKVIPAQLRGQRASRAGGDPVEIEATLHKRERPAHEDGADKDGVVWRAFLRPAKRAAIGDDIAFGEGFSARVEARGGAEAVLRFLLSEAEFARRLHQFGAVPLPPYIARKRSAHAGDAAAYQTIYAREPGSVAAPTAGLHFTADLMEQLSARGVQTEWVTLHVGAGTFLPVTADDTRDHRMHAEWGEITAESARRMNESRARGGRLVAVGTTSLRLLESAAGADGVIAPFADETDIFITPGYAFRTADLLLTNFHLPRSTLFMLVSAFSGVATMQDAYRRAIEEGYRFYSYGDACLLERCE